MFTGIVRGLCPVHALEDKDGGRRLVISLGKEDEEIAQNVEDGASIANNGTCLTVVYSKNENGNVLVAFDAIQETLNRTNLGELKVGDKVNIERAMKIGDEIGGHNVSGHIDGIGIIENVIETPNNREVVFRVPKGEEEEYMAFLAPKGWIAVDGISLTVVKVTEEHFSVCLIPETLARTTLGFKGVGDKVNLEFDGQAKIIVRTMERLLPDMIKRQMSKI
eukprot:Clim_evm108s172 gene=Clim_evmTU108s172